MLCRACPNFPRAQGDAGFPLRAAAQSIAGSEHVLLLPQGRADGEAKRRTLAKDCAWKNINSWRPSTALLLKGNGSMG